MDLADLDIFRAVVQAGGVTRAAEKLNRVQSNVTTRVRQLETDLGVQLFIRRKQGIENLAELIKQLKIHDYHFREHAHVLCEIQAVLAEMRGVQKEIDSLNGKFEFFLTEKEKKDRERTLELLALRIKHLHFTLEHLAKRGSERRSSGAF